jgi:hypothetical protein
MHEFSGRFEETASTADLPVIGKSRSATTEESLTVMHSFRHSPKKWLKRGASEMEVSESVLHLTLLSLGVAARMNDDDSDDVWIVL